MKTTTLLFLFSFLMIGSLHSALPAPNPTDPPGISKDSIPRIAYIGYRLYLTQFEVIKEKKGMLYVRLSAINTGNKNMPLGRGASQIFPVVKFDPSINTSDLLDFQTAIYFNLLEEKLTIPIGAISTNIELKLPLIDKEEEAIVAAVAKTKKNTKENKNEPDESKVGNETVAPELPPTITASKDSQLPSEDTLTEQQEEQQEQQAVKTVKEPDQPAMVVAENLEKEADENACADLVLQNINVLKRNKNSILLEYELHNQGKGKASLVIGKKKDQQSMAIRANLSSSEKLTRGSLVISSTFLYGDEITLAGGESFFGKIKLELHKLTKFTPYLILELDAFEFIAECDESNNMNRLRLLEEEQ